MNNIKIFDDKIHEIQVCYIKVPFSLVSHVGFLSLSGSHAENENNQGVAHYLEHMFFKGTKKRNLFTISDDAALLGADQNAYTNAYNTHYYLNVPKINTEGALELLCDMMFNPIFPIEEIEKERTVIQEERKMSEDDPYYSFFEESEKRFFNFDSGHFIIGTEETINSINRNDIVNYHKKMYNKGNVILVIVSDINEKEIFSICKKYLKNNTFEDGQKFIIDNNILNSTIGKEYEFYRPNIQQSYIMAMFSANGLKDELNKEKETVIDSLGGDMYSILFKEIREKLGLCYYINSCNLQANLKESVLCIYSQLSTDNLNLLKSKVIDIIHDIKNNGFSEDIFNCSKSSQLGNFCRKSSDVYILANNIGKNKLFEIDNDPKKEYENIINLDIKNVNKYASEYLPNEEDIYWSIMKMEDLTTYENPT